MGEQMAKIIKQWHSEARERKKKQEKYLPCTPRSCLYIGSANGFSSLRRPTPVYKEEIIRGEQEEPSTSSRSGAPSPMAWLEMPTLRRE